MAVFETVSEIWSALASGNDFQLKNAFESNDIYIIMLPFLLFFGWLLSELFRRIPFIDQNIEKWTMILIYMTITAIIFVEVIRRFTVGDQVPWSSTLPPYLFLIMTWIGCSYGVKRKLHLAFGEARAVMNRNMQMVCLTLDAVLWIGFAWIVLVTGSRLTVNAMANFQILLGTDNVMQWWFYFFVPFSWLMLTARAIENWRTDWGNYRAGNPLIEQSSLVSGD